MEDNYELVSKDAIIKLREENKKLKEEISKKTSQNDNSDFIEKIIAQIHEESSKEKELVLQSLNEIKELNKTTLNNLIEKTQSLDKRLENMVNTTTELVRSFSEVVETFSKDNNSELKEILEKINNLENQNKNNSQDVDILQKLEDIETFMKNLRILLSYVKPSDMTTQKKF